MRISTLLFCVLIWLYSAAASAQEVDAQAFKPNPWVYLDGLPTTMGGATSVKGSWVAGFLVNYQRAPLTLWQTNPWRAESHIIGHQITGDLSFAYSVLSWFDAGVVLPVVLYQSGDGLPDGETPAAVGIGDVRLLPRVRLYGRGGLSFALIPQFVLPTGQLADPYMGRGGLQFIPTVAASYRRGPLTVSGNLYYRLVEDVEVAGLKLHDEMGLHVGASYALMKARLHLFSEVYGRTLAAEPFADVTQTPWELLGGAKYRLTRNITVVGGLSAGLTRGYTAPDYRLFAGVGYGQRGSEDPDNDGIFGEKDKCPNEPEDKDGYRDDDGCPDPDNDNDGVPDAKDGAPGTDADEADNFAKTKEDRDGYKDDDGVPDPDNDGDGIPDTKDKCPGTDKDAKNGFKDTRETVNGYKDKDGCPEKDSDGDGVVDGRDQCPNKPEDKDGFDDEDGCPDPDNDEDGVPDAKDGAPGTDKDVVTDFVKTKEDRDGYKDDDGIPDPDNDGDGIPDTKDKCPGTDKDAKNGFKNTKENINGVKDFDGCPDKGKSLVTLTATRINILQRVYFAYNKAKIKRRSHNLLNQVANILKTYRHITLVEIQGHTDQRGRRERNMTLSARRARAVRNYLVSKGIKASRLTFRGYGPDNPLKTCKGLKRSRDRRRCRAANRRVEFVIKKFTPPASK